jgi:hypothetical protein
MTEEYQALARICHCSADSCTYISGLGQKELREKELRQNGLERQKPTENPLIHSGEFDVGIVKEKNGKLFLWILSELLRRVLLEVLTPEKGVLIQDNLFCIPYPFALLSGRRDGVKKALDVVSSEEAQQAWKALDYSMVTYSPNHTWISFQKPARGGEITYDQLWALFIPGEKVVVMDLLGSPQVLIFVELDYKFNHMRAPQSLVFSVSGIVWNPKRGGICRAIYSVTVLKFLGSRLITSLPIYPIRFASSEEEQFALEKTLSNRGRWWQKVVSGDMTTWTCKGSAILDSYKEKTYPVETLVSCSFARMDLDFLMKCSWTAEYF